MRGQRMADRHRGITRRTLLRGALVAGGGLGVLSGLGPLGRLARGDDHHPDAPDRRYIFAYFPGGWDVLLSLDPRDPARFDARRLRDTRIQPGYELLQGTDGRLVEAGGHTFGPYIGDLAAHVDRLAVVRGMSMDTLTHEVGRLRFLTGKPPSGLLARGSSASTWLAGHFGGAEPIPNLAVQVENYNDGLPDYATALGVNSVADLVRALRPSEPLLGARVARQVDATLAEAAACARGLASPLWRSAEAGRQKAREMVAGGLADLFDFGARTPEMEALRDRYGFAANAPPSPEVHAALAVQAITQGVSRCVSVTMSESLDTHFDDWTTDQGPRQARGFAAVARMIEDLAVRPYGDTGDSWLDHTVVIGFSEFSRTPLLNVRGGRDHHLTNSCFLAGGGVRGGQVIGASSDVGMTPLAVDRVTGRPDPGGAVLYPEHVIQTLFDEVGIGVEADLRVPVCRVDPVSACADAFALPVLMRT